MPSSAPYSRLHSFLLQRLFTPEPTITVVVEVAVFLGVFALRFAIQTLDPVLSHITIIGVTFIDAAFFAPEGIFRLV